MALRDVVYEANPIDRSALLRLDSRFMNGLIFLDEINLEYGEARRSSSNVNLSTDTLIQQLRKFQCGLIYTVIDEMFVDMRIRDNTDIFIMCKDTAAYSSNLIKHKPQGHDFEWMLYAKSWRLLGEEYTYSKTQKGIGPIPLNMRKLWGTIDTLERQAKNRDKYTEMGKELLPIELAESPAVSKARTQWSWLQDKALEWRRAGIRVIEPGELPMRLGCPVTPDIKQWLGVFGVYWSNDDQGYIVNDFSLERPSPLLVPA